MNLSNADFHERLARINGRNAAEASTARHAVTIDRNGYMIVRGAGRKRGFPWHGVSMVVVSFFMIKALMMSQFGPDFYAQDIARLGNGSVVEQAAAWTMRPDPVSRWIALQLKFLG